MPYVKDCNKIDICVYFHRRLVDYKVFYVGMGKIKRAMSSGDRSKWWQNVVKKYGYRVEIVHENLHWEEAARLEIFYIKKFGRADQGKGILVNMTDGGDGAFGKIPWKIGSKLSKETKDKISKSRKGKCSKQLKIHLLKQNSIKAKKVVITSITNEIVGHYSSLNEAARTLDLDESCLSKVCQNKRFQHNGYKAYYN